MRSPISAGRVLSLLCETSKCLRFIRWLISGGSLCNWLLLMYKAVRFVIWKRAGLRFRMFPVSSISDQVLFLPAALSSDDMYVCIRLLFVPLFSNLFSLGLFRGIVLPEIRQHILIFDFFLGGGVYCKIGGGGEH